MSRKSNVEEHDYTTQYKKYNGDCIMLAKHYKVSARSIDRYNDKFGFFKNVGIDKDFLIELYCDKNQSVVSIAKMLDRSPSSVYYWLSKYEIKKS